MVLLSHQVIKQAKTSLLFQHLWELEADLTSCGLFSYALILDLSLK